MGHFYMDYSFQARLNNWSKSSKNRAFAISASRRYLIIFATARAKITAATEKVKPLSGKGFRESVPKMGHF